MQKEIQKFILIPKQRGIYFKRCGKLIVASNASEEKVLLKIQQNASENGILLKYKDKKLKELNQILCHSALYSKTSGIIDSHDLMLNFLNDIEEKRRNSF